MGILFMADDLSGAADTAAALGGTGSVGIMLFDDQKIHEIIENKDIIVVDLNIRDALEAEVRRRIIQFLSSVESSLPEHRELYLKIDSALRGPVVSMIESIINLNISRKIVLCPAFPQQRRTYMDGKVLIDRVPISRTAFGRSQGLSQTHPALEGKLAERGIAGRPVKLDEIRDPEVFSEILLGPETVFLAEAETATDLQIIADTTKKWLPGAVMAGSSALARCLRPHPAHGRPDFQSPGFNPPFLYLLGSTAPIAREQISRVGNARNFRSQRSGRISPDEAREICFALNSGQNCILSTEPPASGLPNAKIVQQMVDSLPLDRLDFQTLLLSGGATARSVFDKLGVRQFCIRGELEPGIAYGSVDLAGREVGLILKSGSFGDIETLARIAKFVSCEAKA